MNTPTTETTEKKKKDFRFTGFDLTKTTPIPDNLFDLLLTELSGAETKVLLYLMRRTRGWGNIEDTISLSQFQYGILKKDGEVQDFGCGIKRRETICAALVSLEKKNIICSQKNGRNVTSYKLCCLDPVVSESDQVVTKSDQQQQVGGFKSADSVVSKTSKGGPVSAKKVVRLANPQETVLQETIQETNKQEVRNGVADATANMPAPSPSQIEKEVSSSQSSKPTSEKTIPETTTATGLESHSKQEQAFWALWLQVDQNKKVPPMYKPSATDHVKAFAPHIISQEEIDSLVCFTRKKMSEQLKRPILRIELGNLRTHYGEWDMLRQQKRLGISPLGELSNRPGLKPIIVPKPEDRSWMSRRLDTRTGKVIEIGVYA
jgi:hypothetical protein